jgi:hypothetical protein
MENITYLKGKKINLNNYYFIDDDNKMTLYFKERATYNKDNFLFCDLSGNYERILKPQDLENKKLIKFIDDKFKFLD